jgi:hypothetical protein
MAASAVNDLTGHYWTGSATSGYITPTFGGLPSTAPGVIWERGTFLFDMENLWEANQDPVLQQRIQADWNFLKQAMTYNGLTIPGVGSYIPAEDDSGWDVWYYLKIYNATNDAYALECAEALADNAFNRWYDSALGGGMWYDDSKTSKAAYQACNTLGYLKIWEITRQQKYLDHALLCYTWMEKRMLNSYGLYWGGYSSAGPGGGGNRPFTAALAHGGTLLAGQMAMGVLHARLYRDTGEQVYLYRALRTAAAVRKYFYVDSNGVLVDDGDAWTNGTFAADWAREVLSLPGTAPQDLQILKNTATAVYTKDRTSDGYYGGCWDGPVGTSGDLWSNNGSTPQQIMTSSQAVAMIVGAANLPN